MLCGALISEIGNNVELNTNLVAEYQCCETLLICLIIPSEHRHRLCPIRDTRGLGSSAELFIRVTLANIEGHGHQDYL